jgi:hypothetical protein
MFGVERMLSKKEAAEYLGISAMALERYINDGKLPICYQSSPYGDVALFEEGQLAQIRSTIDRDFELVSMPSRELMNELALFIRGTSLEENRSPVEYSSDLLPLIGFLPPLAELSDTVLFDRAWSILPDWDDLEHSSSPQVEARVAESFVDRFPRQIVSVPSTGLIDVFLVLCARSVGNLISTLTDKSTHKIAPAMLKGKLLLNLAEAEILSGLSQTILMKAIDNNKLPSQLIGKTYRVKSKDLERFVDSL